MFASYQVNIPQSCEQCLSYIWLMDKALLCSGELCPVLANGYPTSAYLLCPPAHCSEGSSQTHAYVHTYTETGHVTVIGLHACRSYSF